MTLSMASVLSPFAKFVLVHRSSSFLSFETLERRREESNKSVEDVGWYLDGCVCVMLCVL